MTTWRRFQLSSPLHRAGTRLPIKAQSRQQSLDTAMCFGPAAGDMSPSGPLRNTEKSVAAIAPEAELLFSLLRGKGKSWEVNREGGAFSRAGVDVHRAFGLFDEALDNAQSEPRALTFRLGREVWLKDFGQKFRRNAGPIVTH